MIRLFKRKEKTPAAEPAVAPPHEVFATIRQFIDPAVLNVVAAHMVAQFVAARYRGVVVCGTSPGAGASFTSLHLAAAFAQQGQRTLLMDADLRSPESSRPFERGQSGGLALWLTSDDG